MRRMRSGVGRSRSTVNPDGTSDNSERGSRTGHRRKSGSCQYGNSNRPVHPPAPKLRKNRDKDPVFGVIGIQAGPRERWVHIGFHGGDGSRFWDADRGDDCEDPASPFARKQPIQAICREFRVSRKVVRQVIRLQASEFRYERSRQPLPRIDPWRKQLDELLLANEGKPRRERLTLIRIFEELRGLGYEGGYDAVRRYARSSRKERVVASVDAFVPLIFEPGEATSSTGATRSC
jgi:hypothetical protein